MAGIAIGLTVMLDAYIGGPLTGASMNPARSLAPLLFENRMDVFWLYCVGPMAGALAGAFTYKGLRCDTEDPTTVKGCC